MTGRVVSLWSERHDAVFQGATPIGQRVAERPANNHNPVTEVVLSDVFEQGFDWRVVGIHPQPFHQRIGEIASPTFGWVIREVSDQPQKVQPRNLWMLLRRSP